MIDLVFFAHGTSVDNEEHRSSGWHDCALSSLGEEQTIRARDSLLYRDFDLYYSSDLVRAKQTANILFPDKNIIYDSRLRECNYGILNGTLGRQVVYEDHIESKFPQGESLINVQERMEWFLSELLKSYDGKRIAIVSHRAPQLALEVIINKLPWQDVINNDWRLKGKWQPGWLYKYGKR
ncbi:MAG: histidine phosphatase family protein [Clostridia bacterium]|uniref:histidine phosphatase family protein n=1 Tax=Anaerocaecibacter muris TaxID=2941513 RepID=UPI00203E5F5F|nr:histidine phosphatase family protein [Anaerocaecibacter muris]MCX4384224.1 histidine phosphatase family protein [Clostridia bacterium]